jgi:galactokinase
MSNDNIAQDFYSHFNAQPEYITRAPGRVNLIGEHTDYNDGWVLPIAIDYDIRLAIKKRPDRTVRLYSADFNGEDSFDLDNIGHADSSIGWSNYPRGVADVLQKAGYKLGGMDAVISGNVPRGAGLSSSAAIELATATAFRILSGLDISPVKAALLCQKAENEFVGMHCGIMDQFISSLGKANSALLVDCRTLDYKLVQIPAGVSVLVINSGVSHSLVDSAYNERREQCETGARILGVKALRDVSVEMFTARESELSELTAKRCRHVVTEDQRVLDGVKALNKGDMAAFGRLMNASHQSLRDWYEVSTPELDALADIQQHVKGCYGARLTGAGFGGCTVALVDQGAVQKVVDVVKVEYPARTGKTPEIHVCHATTGASVIRPSLR